MVVGEGKVNLVADGDDVTSWSFEDRGFLFDRPDAEDGRLRLVDDRGTEERARGAVVRDGEGTARHLVWGELTLATLVGKESYLLCDAGEAELIGITDDGHDEVAIGKGNSHTYVDVLTLDDVIAIDRCIDAREVLECACYGLDDRGHISE